MAYINVQTWQLPEITLGRIGLETTERATWPLKSLHTPYRAAESAALLRHTEEAGHCVFSPLCIKQPSGRLTLTALRQGRQKNTAETNVDRLGSKSNWLFDK